MFRQKLINKIENSNKDFLYLICFGLIYLILNYQDHTYTSLPNRQLDSSWMVGLNWASFLKLRWLENNMVFTYGPLYYLNGILMPQFHSNNFIIATTTGLNLFYTGFFTYIYSLFANLHSENKNRWIQIVVGLILFLQIQEINLIPLFVAFISLPIIFREPSKTIKGIFERYLRFGIISLLLAVIPFIKFTHVYESYLYIIVIVSFLIFSRKYLDAAIIGILFAGFTILTWVLTTGESVVSFFPYLVSRFSISSGYTEAMLSDIQNNKIYQVFILAIVYLSVLTIIFIYLFLTKRWTWAIAWLLPMISLFLGFKVSFVRSGHGMAFLIYIFISALYYFYLVEIILIDKPTEKPSIPWRQSISRFLTPLLALLVLCTFYYQGGNFSIKNKLPNATKSFNSSQQAQKEDQKTLQKIYNLDDNFLNQIVMQKPIDIIPWDINLLYGYNLNWKPRPVIQSYASYTSTLDNLDATFFNGKGSPKQLIFSLFAVDKRYSIFDTPHTFRTLLDNYRFVTTAKCNCYALLKKKEKPLSRDLILISQKKYNFNQNIPIPIVQNAHIFMTIAIEPTVLGAFMNIVYKPTTIPSVEIQLDTGEKIEHSLIRNTAQNGLFVSRYIKNLATLSSIFNETYAQNIIAVRFIGDTSLYNDNIDVHFYKTLFEH